MRRNQFPAGTYTGLPWWLHSPEGGAWTRSPCVWIPTQSSHGRITLAGLRGSAPSNSKYSCRKRGRSPSAFTARAVIRAASTSGACFASSRSKRSSRASRKAPEKPTKSRAETMCSVSRISVAFTTVRRLSAPASCSRSKFSSRDQSAMYGEFGH